MINLKKTVQKLMLIRKLIMSLTNRVFENNSIFFKGIISILMIIMVNVPNTYGQTEPIDLHAYIDTIQVNNNAPPTDFTFAEGVASEVEAIMLANALGGIAPLDILYVSSVNSYYVYGYHSISIVDATTHQLVESIDISNYGVTSPSAIATLTNADAKRLAFNPSNNELYCITEDRNFIVIDVLTNEILESETTNLGDPNSSSGKYYWTFIHFDIRTSKVFVIIINVSNSTEETYYNVFDAVSHNKIHFNNFPDRLNGFAVNKDRDRVYFSFDNKFQVWDISTSNLISEVISDRKMGHILYINDVLNNQHKTICFPFDHEITQNSYACVFDGDNDNSSTFQLDHAYIYDAEYNPSANKIYYSYQNPGHGVKIISGNNYSNIADLSISTSNTMYIKDLKYVDNNTIIGGSCQAGNRVSSGNGGIIIDGNLNSFVEVEEIPKGFNYQIAINNNTNEAALINFLDGSVSFIDNTGIYTGTTALGGSAKQGIYNEVENKVYTYNKRIGKVFINDLDNNQSTVVDIGYIGNFEYISSLVYDADKNLIYISIYSDTDKIKIIDGQTDQLLATEISLTRGHCNGIFYGENDKLYCALGQYPESEVIEIVDLNTLGVITSTIIWPSVNNQYYNTWFDLTINGDIIVCINDIGDNLGGVEIIDKDQNNVQHYYVVPAPYKLAYNPVNNKVYTGYKDPSSQRASTEITIVDLNDGNISSVSVMQQVISLEYCNKLNYLAVFGLNIENDIIQQELITIDGQSEEFTSITNLSYLTSGIKYNPINGNLYVLTAINQSSNETMEYTDLNAFYSMAYNIQSTMQERYWGIGLFIINDKNIILNTQDNQLIIPTGYHSRLNVLQCEEEQQMITTANEYNWLSYPKLERDHTIDEPYNTRSLLENLEPLPDKLTMESKVWLTSVFFYKEGNYWFENDIPTVRSTLGYKLSTTNNGVTWLPLTGTRMEPDYPVNVYANYENWVGYFLLQQQSPMDAFADLLPDMIRAKGHDWTMVKFAMPGVDPVWVLQPQDAQLRYGDMAVVEVTTSRSFQWYEYGISSIEDERETEQFSYTELPDYTPIFIEPDPDNKPIEIGAFVNDTCIGACVVNPSDTLVLLRGYMIGEPGDSVVFENYYSTKSSSTMKISDYYVFNHENKLKEKRTIKLGENKNFHLVSFKKIDEQLILNNQLQLDVYPNPMHNSATISFVNPTDGNIKIEIMDQLGRNVNILKMGIHSAGFHSFKWEVNNHYGTKLKTGIYIIRLTAGSTTAHKKIIVN